MFFKKFSQFPALLVCIFLALGGGISSGKEAVKEKLQVDESVKKETASKADPEEEIIVHEDDEEMPEDVERIGEQSAIEAEAAAAAVARPVSPEAVQVYGWREEVLLDGYDKGIMAKLDTGAYTSSIHAEEMELFERDGKKWVRFIVTEPREEDSPRVRLEAPLVRIARIKEPGGESETREVVRLAFKIGERKLRGDFTLNNRSNMLAAILIGRTTIQELGWIDSSRTNLADKKVMR